MIDMLGFLLVGPLPPFEDRTATIPDTPIRGKVVTNGLA